MGLPIKVITPTQKITIPSLKRAADFEPFNTRIEQAIINISEEASIYDKSLIQLKALESCCKDTTVDFHSLPVAEIGWLFIQLRKISVGRTLDLQTHCKKCENDITFKIDIDSIEFESENLKPFEFQIQTSEGPYIVHCEHLRVDDLKDMDVDNTDLSVLAKYIRWMSKPDGNNVLELTDPEKLELFGQLEASMAHKIGEYSKTQPKMKFHVSIECPECGEINEGELTDFFQ